MTSSLGRYEITEVMPDRGVQIAMDKQAVAERDRREQVLQAEGTKRSVGMRGNIKERERESKRERERASARAHAKR